MPTVKLTDAAVQKFKVPKGQRVEYFDATLPGFGLRVAGPTPRNPEGRKSWVLFYRLKGEQRRITLEQTYPTLTLAAARTEAAEALQLVDKGIDPAQARASLKAENEARRESVASAIASYMERGLKGRSKGYLDGTRANFENHVLPRWRDRDLTSISRRDVVALLDAVAAGQAPDDTKAKSKAKRPAGGPVAANRVLAAVRSLFNWAISRDLIQANPCAMVKPPGEETRRERTLAADEIYELWPVFESLSYPFGAFLRMALLTGQRRSEVAGMRWEDVDLTSKTWTLSASQTKNRNAHVVPLSQAAVDILTNAPRKSAIIDGKLRPSPFVFTSDGKTPISGFSRAKAAADKKIAAARAAAKADPLRAWGIHDLRRTCATELGRLKIPEQIISRVLNHTAKSITVKHYNKYSYLEEKREALDTWAAYLERLIRSPGSNVVELRA